MYYTHTRTHTHTHTFTWGRKVRAVETNSASERLSMAKTKYFPNTRMNQSCCNFSCPKTIE